MTDQQEEFCATGAAPYPVILGRLIRVIIDGVTLASDVGADVRYCVGAARNQRSDAHRLVRAALVPHPSRRNAAINRVGLLMRKDTAATSA